MKAPQTNRYLAAGITAFLVIAASILLFFLIYHLDTVRGILGMINRILRPIYYGMVLAFLLLPIQRHILRFLMAMTSNHHLEQQRNVAFLRTCSIVFSLLFAILVIYVLLAMVMPQLYTSVMGLIDAFPDYVRNVQSWFEAFFADHPELWQTIQPYYDSISPSVESWLKTDFFLEHEDAAGMLQWMKDSILPNLTGVVTSVSAGVWATLMLLKDLLIAVIVSVYLLARKDTFAAQSKKIAYSILRTDHADFLVGEVRNAYAILSGFINGKLLDSLIIGIIALVCCNLFHFPYPMLLAVIIGVTDVIPFFGPFIGAIPCALLILLVSPLQCIYFCIFVLVLQQFDGNILGPKILGDSTGLDSFWVLFSILLAGGLFGFAGMVLGVPVFAMIYSILSRLVAWGLKRRGLPPETGYYLGPTGPQAKKEPPSKQP